MEDAKKITETTQAIINDKKINIAVEINILVALFKAATEQTRMLNGAFRHRQKLAFSNMQKAAEHWLSIMEIESKQTLSEQEFTDNITDAIHEVCDYLRKEMQDIIDKQNEERQNSSTSNS
jgi:hypothetical protein